MTDSLEPRGPDDSGIWRDSRLGVGLGHRRLAIIDLSAEGHQPMISASGRYVAAYNGEVYNFGSLREEIEAALPDYPFRGTSDTEVLLAIVERYGLHEALQRTNGMFGFALWDREERELHLVRDRLGIKPLYYGRSKAGTDGPLLFGSTLRAIRAFPGFSSTVDRRALANLLRYNSIPAPNTIFEGVRKVPPASIATFRSPDVAPEVTHYWSAIAAAEEGLANPFGGSAEDAVELLESQLRDAVGSRLVSDVPLGAFLSGGIDSSTVVALMQEISPRPIKTFSIGFDREEYNEAVHAAAVAKHLGTDHHEWYITAEDALAVIPRLAEFYEEPFADSSQIPTYLVSQLARREVTVALSGDGGDELFGGYNRHLWAPRVDRLTRLMPSPARRGISRLLGTVTPARANRLYGLAEGLLPAGLRMRVPAEKLQKLSAVLECQGREEIYTHLRSDWQDPAAIVQGVDEEPIKRLPLSEASFSEAIMLADILSYLPDDILTKVDRASMAVSLEARVPLLDHRVVELAWRLPLDLKIRQGTTKWILRQVLYKHVPRRLIERPKMGFGVPIDEWLREELRPWAEELLDEDRLRREGYLDPTPIRRIWTEHLDRRANHQHKLWNVLAFQAFLDHG